MIIVKLEGQDLADLVKAAQHWTEDGTYRLRIAIDGGQVKVKRNEGEWTHGMGEAQVRD